MWYLLVLFKLCLKYRHRENTRFYVCKGLSLAHHCEWIAPEQLTLLLPYWKPSLSQVSLHQSGAASHSLIREQCVSVAWSGVLCPTCRCGGAHSYPVTLLGHSSADIWSQHKNGEQPPRRPAMCWITKPMFKCLLTVHSLLTSCLYCWSPKLCSAQRVNRKIWILWKWRKIFLLCHSKCW